MDPEKKDQLPTWRYGVAGVGVLCIGLAGLGAVLPGLPTTIFLIAASYCFTRSIPALERRMMRTRLFRPYLRLVDGKEAMSLRARVVSWTLMWTAVTISLLTLHWRGALGPALAAVILAAAAVGTVAIALFRRRPKG